MRPSIGRYASYTLTTSRPCWCSGNFVFLIVSCSTTVHVYDKPLLTDDDVWGSFSAVYDMLQHMSVCIRDKYVFIIMEFPKQTWGTFLVHFLVGIPFFHNKRMVTKMASISYQCLHDDNSLLPFPPHHLILSYPPSLSFPSPSQEQRNRQKAENRQHDKQPHRSIIYYNSTEAQHPPIEAMYTANFK